MFRCASTGWCSCGRGCGTRRGPASATGRRMDGWCISCSSSRRAAERKWSGIADGLRNFGKRNELLIVAGDRPEAHRFPVVLRLVDPVARGRNEVPEDIAAARERLSAQQHDPSAGGARQACLMTGPKHIERERIERLSVD